MSTHDFMAAIGHLSLGVVLACGGGSSATQAAPPGPTSCAAPDSGWIWCDDFETDRLSRYFEVETDGGSLSRASAVGRNGSWGMRTRFVVGQVSAGSMKLAFGRTPDAYFRPVDAGTGLRNVSPACRTACQPRQPPFRIV